MNNRAILRFFFILLLCTTAISMSHARGILEMLGIGRDSEIETGEADPVQPANLPSEQNETPPPETAVMQNGPDFRKGMPYFLPNAIPVFTAEYEFRGRLFTLYYTMNEFPGAEAWEQAPCGENMTRAVPVRVGENVVFRQIVPPQNPDYKLFISYSTDTDAVLTEDEVCLFIDAFIRRFRYFFGISSDRTIPPFPAVVPLD